MKILLPFILCGLILSGCISQEEKQRRHSVIIGIEKSIEREQSNQYISADVKRYNIQFLESWRDDLKKRGYK